RGTRVGVTAGCPGLRPEPRCDRRAAADSTANRRSGCAPASRSSAPASPALARAARLASVCADSRARLPRSCDLTRSEAAPAAEVSLDVVREMLLRPLVVIGCGRTFSLASPGDALPRL